MGNCPMEFMEKQEAQVDVTLTAGNRLMVALFCIEV
jgi:hypothetical protein